VFSVDVDRVAELSSYSFTLFDCFFELFIGTFLLYQWLGIAGVIGLLVNLVFLPFSHYTSKAFASTQDALMSARDRRVSLMNELLAAIRAVKYFAWELPFEARVNKIREEELKQLRRNYSLEIAFDVLWSISPVVCILVAFWYFTKVQGNALTPAVAFASLSVFNELKFALNALPDVFVSGLQTLISLRRIEAFMALPEVSEPTKADNANQKASSISMQNATISWPSIAQTSTPSSPLPGAFTPRRKFLLSDVTLRFPPGELSLVTGATASGKTLLLHALLGEADLLAGQVECPRSDTEAIARGRTLPQEPWEVSSISFAFAVSIRVAQNPHQVAYVPQTAWLQNASIKDNILFGSPYNHERYNKVLHACSLLSDLAIMEDGDQTEVGERGITLSGGQKQRVSFARAVYSRAGVLLLDGASPV
jgi:ABC-type multidrug transport system fused ATPase/permease subunit